MNTALFLDDHAFELTQDSQAYLADIDIEVHTECFAKHIHLDHTSLKSRDAEAFSGHYKKTSNDRESMQNLRSARNELIVELMQEVLPAWIRKRWTSMLLEMDLATSITDEKLERLSWECSCARGNLGRLMPDATCEYRSMADTELLLLANGLKELENDWLHHKHITSAH